jgi:hypothetical protein
MSFPWLSDSDFSSRSSKSDSISLSVFLDSLKRKGLVVLNLNSKAFLCIISLDAKSFNGGRFFSILFNRKRKESRPPILSSSDPGIYEKAISNPLSKKADLDFSSIERDD